MVTSYWINPQKRRYYRIGLMRDLFDQPTIMLAWGGMDSRRGGVKLCAVPSYADGLRQIDVLEKRRKQHGYSICAA